MLMQNHVNQIPMILLVVGDWWVCKMMLYNFYILCETVNRWMRWTYIFLFETCIMKIILYRRNWKYSRQPVSDFENLTFNLVPSTFSQRNCSFKIKPKKICKMTPAEQKFVWSDLSSKPNSHHRISRAGHCLKGFQSHFIKINHQLNLQCMFHRLRYHTSIWTIKIKFIALCPNIPILLFFVANCWFFCLLHCDCCNVSCLWTANGFFCFTTDYECKVCLFCSPHLRVFQVKSIWFYTYIKVAEFITVCVDCLVLFLFVTIEIIDVVTPHNAIMQFFFCQQSTCLNWSKWFSHAIHINCWICNATC